jgi:nitroreductase
MELDKAIKERHSVRKFSSKKVNWRDVVECIDLARYAPMAGNNLTVKFILVDDAEKIQTIGEACQQPFVSTAKYIVVVCSNPDTIINSYGKKEGEIYSRQQAGAAIENFLLKVTEKKLATCWVGYFAEDIVRRTLDIPNGVNIEAIFPMGYEYEKQARKKHKTDLDLILYFNTYKERRMNPERKQEV